MTGPARDLNGKTIATSGSITNRGTLHVEGLAERSAVVSSGGNHAIFSNYGTLHVEGGTCTNVVAAPQETDCRRGVWTGAGSTTTLRRGLFVNEASPQTICCNGDAPIDGAEVTNSGKGYDCLASAGATLLIGDGSISAQKLLYLGTDSYIYCRGGIYSAAVGSRFLEEGFECVDNTDPLTAERYPYKVQPRQDGQAAVLQTLQPAHPPAQVQTYDLHGRPHLRGNGLILLRMPDEKVKKTSGSSRPQ